jgi:benzoylformate decarboxylase
VLDGIISEVAKVAARRGADVLLEVLESEGVRYIFGNPGTTELPLMDALVDAPALQYILALQEASAGPMAGGYAQAARRPAFLNLHTAGGLGHGMGAAQCQCFPDAARGDGGSAVRGTPSPIHCCSAISCGSPLRRQVGKEIPHADRFDPGPAGLPRLRRATDWPGLPRLPMDILEEMTATSIAEVSIIERKMVAGSLDLLADHLAAIRPGKLALIAGDEVSASNGAPEVVLLAEALGAPVYGSSWPLHIPFPTSHPLWAGNLPTKASEIAETLKPYDAIFALGGKSLITIVYTEASAVPPGCDVFQMSADVRDLGRTYATKLSVVGDIKASVKTLLPLLVQRLAGKAEAYAGLCVNARREQMTRRAQLNAAADAAFDAPLIAPIVAARETARAIGPQIAIVDEAPATTFHLRDFLDSASTQQYSFSRGGALGWGMPAAVGFSLGLGRAPVVSIVGDGAALYSPQALWTAVHEKLPVTFVVINNREYNILKKFLRSQPRYASARENRFIAMDLVDPAIDFLALASSMGVAARRVSRAADIAPAIAAGIASGTTNLIEILVSAA